MISRRDAHLVGAVAVTAGVVAALAGCEPTGAAVPDAVLTMALAGFVTWLGASVPWWAITVSGGLVGVVAAAEAQVAWVTVAWAAVTLGLVIGGVNSNQPALRAVAVGAVVQVALRLAWNPFFLAPALVAAAALGLLAVVGWRRRRRPVRLRVLWAAAALAGAAVLAAAAFGFAAWRVRDDASDGYHAMLEALELLQDGELTAARGVLLEASGHLHTASAGLDGPLTQPARLVPGLAQNRNIAADLMRSTADAADAVSAALDTVDLERLRIVDGAIDLDALAQLEPPLAELEATVLELQGVLRRSQSPWLVGPLSTRLDSARVRADQVAVQAVGSHAAARHGPALLGRDGPRRYLVAFTNPAESRGQSGVMGNWSELTITRGRIEHTASGRTNDLSQAIDASPPIRLDMPADYLARHAGYGADRGDGGVDRKYWVNAFVSPDAPSVGRVLAQLYTDSTGRTVDGVLIIDPRAIGGILQVTGPIRVDGLPERLSAGNAERFLTLDQYEFAENEREDFLAAATTAMFDQLLGSTLPPPQQLGRAVGPAATEGHLTAWMARPDEQRLLELVGMDAAMPVLADLPATDALAITANNASGNKIDTFLERSIVYRPVVDERSGQVAAELEITVTNTAPPAGYNDYVIGNLLGEPPGTNRMLVELWSALEFDTVQIDGADASAPASAELGWNIVTLMVDVPPGGTTVVTASLAGAVRPGDYQLVYRPQPLPRPDTVDVVARTADGDTVLSVDEPVLRRSLITRAGVAAWRPSDHPAR